MKKNQPFKYIFASMFALAAAGCSPSVDSSTTKPEDVNARVFSAADKAAARALSVGDERGLAEFEDNSERAKACVDALASMQSKLGGSGNLNATQVRALAQARAYYANQVGPEPTEPDDQQFEEEEPEFVDEQSISRNEGRTAIACLRRLQGGSGLS